MEKRNNNFSWTKDVKWFGIYPAGKREGPLLRGKVDLGVNDAKEERFWIFRDVNSLYFRKV
jgi:hypothetical protein